MVTKPRFRLVLMACLPAALLLLASCGGGSAETKSAIDLAPFKALAKAGGCADIRNRLFVVDDEAVFWERKGNCADASYAQTLYGCTPDQVLCTAHDSIAGPVRKCEDAKYQDLFDTITANLDKTDLGLGSGHTVKPIDF